MGKIGRGLFGGARRFHQQQVSRRSARSLPSDEGAGLLRRSMIHQEFDEEAPPLMPRRLQRDGMHSSAPSRIPSQTHQSRHYANMNYDELRARIVHDQDEHWEEKKKEKGADFDEEDVLTKYAMDQLLKADSSETLILTADVLIAEDWLGKVDALPGNIYRVAVIGGIFVKMQGEKFADNLQAFSKILGSMTIVLIQVMGPPLIFMSQAIGGIGVLNENGYKWHCCPWHPLYDATSHEQCFYQGTLPRDVSQFDDWSHLVTTKALGMTVMAAFILNGVTVLQAERASWKKIYLTFRYLDIKNPYFQLSGTSFMYVDALINIWVVFWCCLDIYLLVGPSSSPADVLMNALALVFLYNLDDVGGDFGFVQDDDWPGLRLAWIHDEMVSKDESFNEDKNYRDLEGLGGRFILGLYSLTIVFVGSMVFLLPSLAAITPFVQVASM